MGAFSGIVYDQASWEKACREHGLTPAEVELRMDNAPEWDLPYPNLSDGEYRFFFTEVGNTLFTASMGPIESTAAAIHCGGELIVITLDDPNVNEELVAYRDRLQVVLRCLTSCG
jgi:hypothetical protein